MYTIEYQGTGLQDSAATLRDALKTGRATGVAFRIYKGSRCVASWAPLTGTKYFI